MVMPRLYSSGRAAGPAERGLRHTKAAVFARSIKSQMLSGSEIHDLRA